MGGIQSTVINPRVIYVQSTQPSDVTQGKLWFDTTDNTLYTSNGSAYVEVGQDTAYLDEIVAELALQVLYLQANATVTPQDYSSMIGDVFSDSGGYLDTINTGSSTATYNATTDVYENLQDANLSESISTGTWGDATGVTNKRGWRIKPDVDTSIVSVTKEAGCDATVAYIQSDAGGAVANANFSGNVATFASPVALTGGTNYRFLVDKGGASYNARRLSGATLPEDTGVIDWVQGRNEGTDDDPFAIATITYEGQERADSIVETNALDITANPTAYMLVSMKGATAGTGSRAYNIKIGSSAYQEDKVIGTKYANTDTGATATIQLQLNGTGTGNESSIGDYMLLLWY